MPGFPTHTVGTPTNRGKARRYKSNAKSGDVKSPLQDQRRRPRKAAATKGYISWRFQRPRLNRMMLTAAMKPSAMTMDQKTPLECMRAVIAKK